MNMNRLQIIKCKDVKTPLFSSDEAAGLDFYVPNDFNNGLAFDILPGNDIKIPLGIKLCLPRGKCLLMCNKSGVATKQKLTNGANLIDSDYLGEISAHMINNSKELQWIMPGQKITQGIILDHYTPDILIVDSFDKETNRGENGFGSTSLY